MFKTLRTKLILSYTAVAALCLLLALVVTVVLARNYSENTIYRTLHEKSALMLPFVQTELANSQRVLPRALAGRVRTGLLRSGTRILFVNPDTMSIEEDISMRSNAIGENFKPGVSDADLSALYTARGVEGKFRLPDEAVTFLYVARSVRTLPPAGVSPAGSNTIVVLAQPQLGIAELLSQLFDYLGLAALVALGVSLIVAFALARSLSRPIARLAQGAAAMARGDYSQRIAVEGQDELASLTERFNEMASQVGKAHEMERDFVANVSHDLKTPLTSIQGFSQAMVDGSVKDVDSYKQAALIINSEAERMGKLVNELLNLSRLQSGLSPFELQPTDLSALLSQLVMAMQPQALAAGVNLRLECKPGITTLADSDKLKQAFGNLIDNALKNTPPNGSITVEATETPQGIEVLVRDTGQGIPAEDLSRVMERFYQVDKSRSSYRSAGLGLAITQEIVRAHQGEITITSKLGVGTTIRVVLPVYPATKPTAERTGMLKRLGTTSKPTAKVPQTVAEVTTDTSNPG